ncbi:hypothetical protein [Candidatus Frankia nodulisporulans]|uniref:hypothetical protein n=1 Tax=Candidatus Frankia nodulisporulans TaxID=2060052 RepID=UPI001583D543|nr:hypothetical protein [Candidatus Frankia nodulisporulans]
MPAPRTTRSPRPTGRCWQAGCTHPAAFVVEDDQGDQAHVCADCQRTAHHSGRPAHPIGRLPRT